MSTLFCQSHIMAPHTRPKPRLPYITVKDILWAFYLYPANWISKISFPCLSFILHLVEPAFQLITIPRKKEVAKNLATLLGSDTSARQLRKIGRRFIANAVWRAADDLLLLRANAKVRCQSFLGREHIESALSEGKGVLLISFHWYANRSSNRYLASIGYPVMSVRNREPRDKFMGHLGQRYLKPKYLSLLHAMIRDEVFIQDPECSLKILQRLRSGGIVDINIDALFAKQKMVLPFLGQLWSFPAGPMHLARTSGCAVLPKFAAGRAQSLTIEIGHPLEIEPGLPKEVYCETYMSAAIKVIESYLLKHPDQWELLTRL